MIIKSKLLGLLAFAIVTLAACGERVGENSVSSQTPTPTPATTAASKDGDYEGRGVVTKIDTDKGSVHIDHEEIKGLMPAMRMEFPVEDKKLLDGVSVDDRVEFVLRSRGRTQTVVRLQKDK